MMRDKQTLNIQLSDDEIRDLSKQQFKSFVRQQVAVKRRQFLTEIQSTKSKSKFVDMGEGPAKYLTDPRFSKEQVKPLFSLRSRTLETKENFKMKFKDNNMLCDICQFFSCSQGHILQCPELVKRAKIYKNCHEKDPDMIYGNEEQQLKIVKIYEEYITIRTSLLSDCSTQSS